jgi:TRAP-type uncharacterized transport system fused permease subunit
VISYVALFYIVHLEALKYDLKPFPAATGSPGGERSSAGASASRDTRGAWRGVLVIEAVRYLFGERSGWVLGALTLASYVALLGYSSRFPDLPDDQPGAKIFHLPRPWPTVRAGLHFFIPIVVLLWCLMVEELSPGHRLFGRRRRRLRW